MTKLAVMGVAVLVLATTSYAQVPQGLGAADPSQQLKTTGFNNFARDNAMTTRNDNAAPLVSGTQDPSDANGPASASATGQADSEGSRSARGAAANAQAAGAVSATAANSNASAGAAVHADTYAGSGSHRRERRESRRERRERRRQEAAPAAAATTPAPSAPVVNPAPVDASAQAGAATDAHMQKIQDLVNEIKSKR